MEFFGGIFFFGIYSMVSILENFCVAFFDRPTSFVVTILSVN